MESHLLLVVAWIFNLIVSYAKCGGKLETLSPAVAKIYWALTPPYFASILCLTGSMSYKQHGSSRVTVAIIKD